MQHPLQATSGLHAASTAGHIWTTCSIHCRPHLDYMQHPLQATSGLHAASTAGHIWTTCSIHCRPYLQISFRHRQNKLGHSLLREGIWGHDLQGVHICSELHTHIALTTHSWYWNDLRNLQCEAENNRSSTCTHRMCVRVYRHTYTLCAVSWGWD